MMLEGYKAAIAATIARKLLDGRVAMNGRPESTHVTIVLPLPDKKLSPNYYVGSRGRMLARAKAAKKLRFEAMISTLAACKGNRGWKRATIMYQFYWLDRRRRDASNAEASMKSALDGIVDSGLIADDSHEVLRHLPTQFYADKENPRVEVAVYKGWV